MKAIVAGAGGAVGAIVFARGLRGFCDGFVSVLLPVHLLALGHGAATVGLIATATLIGSSLLTLAVGVWTKQRHARAVLLGGAALMIATGLAFFSVEALWAMLLVAFVGTLNPAVGDVSLFLPIEHARLADLVPAERRTTAFAWYSFMAAAAGALGTLAASLPGLAGANSRYAFLIYVLAGVVLAALYARLPMPAAPGTDIAAAPTRRAPLSPGARKPVYVLSALFCVDSFGGGFIVQSLMAVWLFERFGLDVAQAARVLFVMTLLGGVSHLLAPWVARRIGLLNTMVFTHLPSNLCLLAAPFAPSAEIAIGLLFVRAALSSMDVAPRAALVMSLVPPEDRAAAASLTSMPRTLAAGFAPAIAGAMMAASPFGWSLVAGATLKAVYDLLLLAVGRAMRVERQADD
jgi:MFS family permease